MEQRSTNRQENNRQPYEYKVFFYTKKKVLAVAPISKAKACDANCISYKRNSSTLVNTRTSLQTSNTYF